MAAREEWMKPLTADNIDLMVKVIGKVPNEDLRFARYFESKYNLSLVLGDNRIYEEVINQLTGMNRHMLMVARMPPNITKKYQALVEHICELSPYHIEVLPVFLDVFTVVSLTRDRGEMCNDSNALTRYNELIEGDPNSDYAPSQLGLRGQFELESNMVAGEVMVKLGIITREDFNKKADEGVARNVATVTSIFACTACGGLYPSEESAMAVYDKHVNPEKVCTTCLKDLKEQGRLVSVLEPGTALPPAPAAAPAPTGRTITPMPVPAPVPQPALVFRPQAPPAPAPVARASLTCPVCGQPVAPNAKFCSNCGSPQKPTATLCRQCGVELPAAAKFCHDCGTAAPPTPKQAYEQGQMLQRTELRPTTLVPSDKATLMKQEVERRIREAKEKQLSNTEGKTE
jgi:hypothetical protein